MSTGAGYVRVYFSIIDDPRFTGVYSDDHHLATWLRLLLNADLSWPVSATLPRNARMASVKALVATGLVELTEGDRYRIHGLDAERGRRSDAARVGGIASGRSRHRRTDEERPLNERSRTVERTLNGASTVPLNGIEPIRIRAESEDVEKNEGYTATPGAVGRANGRVDPVEGIVS